MATYSDIVQDANGRPMPGVAIYVFGHGTQALVDIDDNPTTTDQFGRFTIAAPDQVYDLEYRFGGVTLREDSVIVGTPAAYIGPTGPSNNTRFSLALLKAASISDTTSLYDGSLWTWTLGNFTGKADDLNIVAANSTSLTVGAWVRSSPTTDGRGYTLPAAVKVRGGSVSPADFLTGTLTDRIEQARDVGIDQQVPVNLVASTMGLGTIDIERRIDWTRPISGGYIDASTPAYLRPPRVFGEGSIIRVAASVSGALDYMFTAKRSANFTMEGFFFDGQLKAKGILDLDWLDEGAPSRNDAYRNLSFANMTGADGFAAVNARGVNDCNISDWSMQCNTMPDAGYAITCPSGGGQVTMTRVRAFNGIIQASCQELSMNGCVLTGLVMYGADENFLFCDNVYSYASRFNKFNLAIAPGAHIGGGYFRGNIYNAQNGGRILLGTGALVSGFVLGGNISAVGGATGVRLIDDGVMSFFPGTKQVVEVPGTTYGIDCSDAPEVLVSLHYPSTDGLQTPRRVNGSQGFTETPGVMEYAARHATLGNLGKLKSGASASVATSIAATVSTTGYPPTGVLTISSVNSACPRAIFYYDLASSTCTLKDTFGSGALTCTISGGNFNISHNVASQSTVFKLTAQGL